MLFSTVLTHPPIFSDQEIVLRGCFSKRKMFHIECESHLTGGRNIQFCYCSHDLCNTKSGGEGLGGGQSLLSILGLVLLLQP